MNSLRRRALVVDDDDVMRATLRALCERHGLEVDEAADGLSALLAAARREPDVVITDVVMPLLDGIELTRRLRAAGSRARIVVLTGCLGHGERFDPDEAIRAGADRVMSKASGMAPLILAVQELAISAR